MRSYSSFKRLVPLLVIPVAVFCLQAAGLFAYAESYAADSLYQRAGIVSPQITVIGIDELTLSEYGAFDTWGRSKIAQLVSLLTADESCSPAVIALDIGFYGEKDPSADAALVEACERAGNVVTAATATFGKTVTENGSGFSSDVSVILYEKPFAALNAVTVCGHTNTQLDDDGVFRHALAAVDTPDGTANSFAQEIYKMYTGSDADIPLNAQGTWYVDFTGKPLDYFGTAGAGASFCRVLDGSYPVSAFKDSVVLIGAYASGMQDNYITASDRSSQMFGVEIHANILQAMLDKNYKTEPPVSAQALVLLLLAAICIVLFHKLGIKLSIPLALITAVIYVAFAYAAYSRLDIILPIVSPVVLILTMMVAFILIRYFSVHREKKRIIASYGKYLSPELAASIAESGESSLALGGTKRDIAVLFVDIRSFTTLSEALSPEQVVEMLNSYLALTTTAIFNNKGTVDKFIGDATMAVFNAPLELEDYTYRAVLTGLEMVESSESMLAKLDKSVYGNVGFGVGINCGDAVVGNIGTDFRMEYTAIGDTVNTASRLEGQAKKGEVICSAAVYERVKDRIEFEYLGERQLKGKSAPVPIYKALGKKTCE